MKTMTRIIQISVLFVAAFTMSAAMACTTGAWNGGATVDPAPLGDTPESALPRVSGKCAMTITAPGGVRDNSPVAEPKVFIRFYVLADLTAGNPVIFEAFAGDDSSLIQVMFDGAAFNFSAGGAPSGPVAGKSGWNMIELAWVGDAQLNYWVNRDAVVNTQSDGSVPAVGTGMEYVVLGVPVPPAPGGAAPAGDPSSFTGKLVFDDYEAHRETAIGELLAGDANTDTGINSGDIDMVVNEFLFGTLAEGVVDCNLDGSVNSGDIDCIVAIFLGL